MSKRPLFEYIFNMLDYADELVPLIKAGDTFAHSYFITLIQVEYVLDSYGRGVVLRSAGEAGRIDAQQLKKEAERRMDELRVTIRVLSQTHDFDETIRQYTEMVSRNWRRLPDDHSNVQWLKEKGLL